MMKHVMLESTETKITNIDEKQVQPNAVDLRVETIERLDTDGVTILTEDGKTHMSAKMVSPSSYDGLYHLPVGYYRVTFDHKIAVGEHEAGWTIPRSTLTRNGVIIHSALYDSGYNGKMVAGLQVTTGELHLEPHARVAQYICVDAESVHLYNGTYQGK